MARTGVAHAFAAAKVNLRPSTQQNCQLIFFYLPSDARCSHFARNLLELISRDFGCFLRLILVRAMGVRRLFENVNTVRGTRSSRYVLAGDVRMRRTLTVFAAGHFRCFPSVFSLFCLYLYGELSLPGDALLIQA